jgi:hypothetical protein
MYVEDVELSRSILRLGWKLYYCADAEIIHVTGGTSEKAPSGFAILMKQESIGKYMLKYYGIAGQFLHRVAVLSESVVNLVLVPFLFVGSCLFSRLQESEWTSARSKGTLLLAWSLGLKRPVIIGAAQKSSSKNP